MTTKILKYKYLILIILLAFILRFYNIGFQSVWLDEIYTLNISNPDVSFAEFHKELLKREGFPHLYFLLLKGLYFIFGYSPIVARSLSAIAGTLVVWAIYKLGKTLHNKHIAYYVALLFAVSEYNIFISQDARPYSLYLLFTILSFYRLVKFIKKDTWKNAIYYGIVTGILLNFNFFGFVNLLSQALLILFFLFSKQKNEQLLFFKKSISAGLISILLFLPAIQKLIILLKIKAFWVPGPKSDSYKIIFNNILGDNEIISFIVWALLVFFVITLFNEKDKFIYKFEEIVKHKRFFSFIVLLVWFTVVLSYLIVSSYGKTSYLLTRYFTSIIPVVFLIVAISIYKIPNVWYKHFMLGILVFFSLINLFFDKKHYSKVRNPQFAQAASFLIQNNKENIPTYTIQKYWFDYFIRTQKSPIQITYKSIDEVVNEMRKDASLKKDFWTIGAFKNEYKPLPTTVKFLNDNFIVSEQFDGHKAWTKHFTIKKKEVKTLFIHNLQYLLKTKGKPIIYQVERLKKQKRLLSIDGFAYFKNQDAITAKIEIIAIKDTIAYRLQSIQNTRQDIQKLQEKYNIENCGFNAKQELIHLKKGKYKIGLYLKDTRTEKEGLIILDSIQR